MPQFDPSVFAPQLFWLVVTFIALYWLVAKVAVPRVGEVLEQRARVIQEDLDRATQLKAETDAALEIIEAGLTAHWAPIRHSGQLHDRASYRYFWQVLQRAHATGHHLTPSLSVYMSSLSS